MGMSVGGNKKQMDEINVTPLIDVVLVLLIIFMVLTPVTVEKMATNLPPTDDQDVPPPPPDQPPDQLMVAVYQDGSVALNLDPKTDAQLLDEVKLRLRSRAKKTVFIDAHPDANYARVITVMDMVREAGADKVGFAELKEEGPAALTPGVPLDGAVPGLTPGVAPPGATPAPVP